MKHSIYITLATWLVRADLHREDRAFQRKIKRSAKAIPWDNPHLLRDIGLQEHNLARHIKDEKTKTKSHNKIARIRSRLALRIPT